LAIESIFLLVKVFENFRVSTKEFLNGDFKDFLIRRNTNPQGMDFKRKEKFE